MNFACGAALLILLTLPLAGQELGDGCGSALDALNRLKEAFYANAENLNFRLGYSNLVTATRNCPDSGELWYFRAILGPKGGAPASDSEYSLRKARALGWQQSDLSGSRSAETKLPGQIGRSGRYSLESEHFRIESFVLSSTLQPTPKVCVTC
jgi:hypothetical protein